MAAHLTDRQKKKIIADYVEIGSYNAVGRKHGVSTDTVKRVVLSDKNIVQKTMAKKAENTADILAHMDAKRDKVCMIMDAYLDALLSPGKIAIATPSQLTTALGTLIDKWTSIADKHSVAGGTTFTFERLPDGVGGDDIMG